MKVLALKEQGLSVVEVLLSIITISLMFGIGYYVWHSQQQVQTAQSSVQSTAAAVKVAAPADDQAQLKTAVINYNLASGGTTDDAKTLVVSVNHDNQSFAIGSITSPQGATAGEWFAKKVNGTWAVISQGADGHCAELAQNGLSDWAKSTCN